MFTPISVLMQERGMSKGELTSRTGLNNSTVWSVLKARHRPQKDTLSAIAKALDITVEEVLESLEAEWQLQAAKKLEAVDGILCRLRRHRTPILPELQKQLRYVYWELQKLVKARLSLFENQQRPKQMNEPTVSVAVDDHNSSPAAKPCKFRLKRRKSRKPQTSCSKAIA
jgi:transcriptional regulator with XRE-family HTH domain